MLRTHFTPDQMVKNLQAISIESLSLHNFACVFIDVNNTLVENNHYLLKAPQQDWLDQCKAAEIKLVLCSNNRHHALNTLAEQLDLPLISYALKPFPFKVRSYLQQHALLNQKIAVIGDQVFTDVLLAKFINAYSIWVAPLSQKDHLITAMIRKLEKVLLNQ